MQGRMCPERTRSPRPPARPSSPRRLPPRNGPTIGTPSRASGRSPRPTPATSSEGESSPGASSPGSARPGPGSRFLAVVGPSGGGKSSVVRAGLVPAIRRGAPREAGRRLHRRDVPRSPSVGGARGRAASDRGASGPPAARPPRFRVPGIARGRRSPRARRVGGRSRGRPVRGGLHARPATSGSGSCSWSRFASRRPTPRAGCG